jgi:hypothetical protein
LLCSLLLLHHVFLVECGCIRQCFSLLWGFLPPQGVGGALALWQIEKIVPILVLCGRPCVPPPRDCLDNVSGAQQLPAILTMLWCHLVCSGWVFLCLVCVVLHVFLHVFEVGLARPQSSFSLDDFHLSCFLTFSLDGRWRASTIVAIRRP